MTRTKECALSFVMKSSIFPFLSSMTVNYIPKFLCKNVFKQ